MHCKCNGGVLDLWKILPYNKAWKIWHFILTSEKLISPKLNLSNKTLKQDSTVHHSSEIRGLQANTVCTCKQIWANHFHYLHKYFLLYGSKSLISMPGTSDFYFTEVLRQQSQCVQLSWHVLNPGVFVCTSKNKTIEWKWNLLFFLFKRYHRGVDRYKAFPTPSLGNP